MASCESIMIDFDDEFDLQTIKPYENRHIIAMALEKYVMVVDDDPLNIEIL